MMNQVKKSTFFNTENGITLQDSVISGHPTYKTVFPLDPLDCRKANSIIILSMIYLGGSVIAINDSDGDTYTKLDHNIGYRTWVSAWSAVGITKSQNKVITLTYSDNKSKGMHFAGAFSGVHQTTPLYGYQGAGVVDDPVLATTPTVERDAIISLCTGYQITPSPPNPTGTNQVEIGTSSQATFSASFSLELNAGTALNNQSWNMTGGNYKASNACIIKAKQ